MILAQGQSFTEKKTEGFFMGQQALVPPTKTNLKDLAQNGSAQLTESDPCTEQRLNSRGGLVERMAARAGFNVPRLNTENIRSAELSLNSEVQSPYPTIPPGISPTTLLESPIFLTNSRAQPSPTTGKFSFFPNGNCMSASLGSEAPTFSRDNLSRDSNPSSFAFKPVLEQSSFSFGTATKRITPTSLPQSSFLSIEVPLQLENTHPSHGTGAVNIRSWVGNTFQVPAELSSLTPEKDNGNSAATDRRVFDSVRTVKELSPPLEELLDEGFPRAIGDSIPGDGGGTFAEDGYNWRKYGQKQVKGSEYPRSYYKCTQTNCPVKKKVEHSHEAHITEIIYKGAHNHPKPSPPKRSAHGSSNPSQLDGAELVELAAGSNADQVWSSTQKGLAVASHDQRHDNVEVTSTASIDHEFGNKVFSTQVQSGSHIESGDVVASCTFSNDDDDDQAMHGSIGYEGEDDESESKRRKIEAYATDIGGASRAIREPRVVVQTTSEVDILDDGYRWRKYGQKVVRGNPNPRSYYKCTSIGCTVRKHVERASHDLKSVITTYEGKHNHDVPAARNSSHVNSCSSVADTAQAAAPVQIQAQRHEPSQVQHNVARSEGTATFGSFGLAGIQQLGPMPSFPFRMNQPGLAGLTMAGLGPEQTKVLVTTAHPYVAQQQRTINGMGFMFHGGQPKVEPVTEHSINLPNNPSVYQQMMNGHPQI